MKRKRTAALILSAIMAASAVGCASGEPASDGNPAEDSVIESSVSDDISAVSETTAAEISETEAAESDPSELEYLKNNFPTFDGSTSAIPLEAAFRSKIFGITEEAAKVDVYHTKTHEAFRRFMDGEIDIVLTVPMTDEQEKQARDKGAEMTPVAKEGFVFCVNKNNPVESLTSQQIKDIYSGKITNWKEVGGEDMAILAYQRNEDSGSQTLMNKFMGDTPLMDAPTELVPMMMGELMDAVAVYDNAAGAIGYSVYSYAAQMYANTRDVKFIAVDGVAPSKETMEDGSYPLLSVTYALYDGTLPEDSPVKRMVRWMTSPEGQQTAREAGYIPAVGGSAVEIYTPLYESLGTGMKRPDGYTLSPWADYAADAFEAGIIRAVPTEEILAAPYDEGIEFDGNISHSAAYETTFKGVTFENSIKNEKASAAVNDWLNTNYAEMENIDPKLLELGFGWFTYEISENETVSYRVPVMVNSQFRNGYLSITLNIPSELADEQGSMRSAVFDLATGEQLELSDMFFEGEDFLTKLNGIIEDTLNDPYNEKVREYAGLREDIFDFDLEYIRLDSNNPYTSYEAYIFYRNEMMGDVVTDVRRDISGMFEDDVQANITEIVNVESTDPVYSNESGFVYAHFGDDAALIGKETADRINGEIAAVGKGSLPYEEYIRRARLHYGEFTDEDSIDEYLSSHTLNVGATVYGNVGYCIYMSEPSFEYAAIFYNIETGKLLTPDDFLKDGWEKEAFWEKQIVNGDIEGGCDAPDISNRAVTQINGISYDRGDEKISVIFSYADGENYCYAANVPAEFLEE